MKRFMKVATLVSILLALAATLFAPSSFAQGARDASNVEKEKQVSPGPVVQPTDAPGAIWKLQPNPMPPVETIVARPPEDRPVYGLYGWGGEYERYRKSIREVGYRSYRMSGPFDDKRMTMLVEDDMETMVTLGFFLVTPEGRTRKNRSHFDSDEAFIAGYVQYAEDFLTRYGPKGAFFSDNPKLPHRPIQYVEILNEPNFHYMLPDKEGVSKAHTLAHRKRLYAKILPATYEAIKAKWPSVTVVGFSVAAGGRSDVPFVADTHKLNPALGASYDVLSIHPYSKPAPPEAFLIKKWGGWANIDCLNEIRKIMAASGAKDKAIWYTEVGWPIPPADGGHFKPPRAKGPVTPIQLQAAYIVRLYALSVRLGVGRVHIMHANDTDRFNGGVFIRGTGAWRPAAFATQTMIEAMPHPKLLGAIHDGADGLYAYRFDSDATDKDTTPVVMAWKVLGPKTIELPISGKNATALGMLGRRTPLNVVDEKVNVEIGPCPIYIVTAP